MRTGEEASGSATLCGQRAGETVVPQVVYDALIQARAVLQTAARDKPEDLGKPERARVIERKVALINEALAALSK